MQALFIDIDETLCTSREGDDRPQPFLGQPLIGLMVEAAVTRNGMARTRAEEIATAVNQVTWCHWTDFIVALDLDPALFWDFAYERESRYLAPVEPGLRRHLEALVGAGWELFITSNNPTSGICHKLRIAGVADIWGSPLFRQYLSPNDLHHMKSDVQFWRRALAHTGLRADAVTVIGDNPHDDVAVPRSAGIASAVLYAPKAVPPGLPEDLPVARNWTEIVTLLAAGRPALAAAGA